MDKRTDADMKAMLNEYQSQAARTLSDTPYDYMLGVMGEAGEVVDVIKKHLYHGHGIAKLPVEVGDLCWYLAALCTRKFGWSLGSCHCNGFVTQKTYVSAAYSLFYCVTELSLDDTEEESHNMIGAVLFLCRELCSFFNVDFETVLDENIEKLRDRYPDKFSYKASINRKD